MGTGRIAARQLEIAQLVRRVGTFAASHKKEETKRKEIPHLDEDSSGKETWATRSVSESGGGTQHRTVEPLGTNHTRPILQTPEQQREFAMQ